MKNSTIIWLDRRRDFVLLKVQYGLENSKQQDSTGSVCPGFSGSV
jgi:hypothetical protein